MEPAGLAIGSVALVSLFSSCVELLTLLEQGRNCVRDVRIAMTKLRLLRHRLETWGNSMPFTCSKFAEGQSHYDITAKIRRDSLVTESLLGIQGLLSNTSRLCGKYGRGLPDLSSDGSYVSFASEAPTNTPMPASQCVCHDGGWNGCHTIGLRGSQSSTASSDTTSLDSTEVAGWRGSSSKRAYIMSQSPPPGATVFSRSFRLLRLKFAWAVFDKREFEGLITDLDFLMSNLEKIGAMTDNLDQTTSQASHANRSTRLEPRNSSQGFPSADLMSAKANTKAVRTQGMTTGGNTTTLNTGMPHQAQEMDRKQKKKGKRQNVKASCQDGPQSTAGEGLFGTPEALKPGMSNALGRGDTIEGNGRSIVGALGEGAPAVNAASFNNHVKDQGRMIVGSGNNQVATDFFK